MWSFALLFRGSALDPRLIAAEVAELTGGCPLTVTTNDLRPSVRRRRQCDDQQASSSVERVSAPSLVVIVAGRARGRRLLPCRTSLCRSPNELAPTDRPVAVKDHARPPCRDAAAMIGSADTGRAETDLAAGWPARGCAARLQPWGHARSGDARPRHDNADPATSPGPRVV